MICIVSQIHPIPTHVQDEYDRICLRNSEAYRAWEEASRAKSSFIKRHTPASAKYNTYNQIADGCYVEMKDPFDLSGEEI